MGAMRRSLVWSIVVGLAVVGSQIAHALAYRAVTPGGTPLEAALAQTGHGYLSLLPLVLAVAVVLVGISLAAELRLAMTGRTAGPPSTWGFAVAAPAIFLCQEHFERLAHDGAFPWTAATERTFVIGLLLQLPFALAGLVAARLLLRVARSVGRRLATLPSAAQPEPGRSWTVRPAAPLRRAALSLGYGTRGPPLPVVG
jgi:hypothetical protein